MGSVVVHFRLTSSALEFARKQLPWWQLSSRYDFLIGPDNRVRFVELNGGFPAGHMKATAALQAARQLWNGRVIDRRQVAEESTWFVRGLVRLETESGINPGLVVIVHDQHGLKAEQDVLCDMLGRLGRESDPMRRG